MTNEQTIKKVAEFVKQKFEGEGSGHDWFHIERVWKTARLIAKSERLADTYLVEISALTHELGDHKLEPDGKEHHEQRITNILGRFYVDKEIVKEVVKIVTTISFSKNIGTKQNLSLQAQIVQDADRLDALGAVGIARAFSMGGVWHRPVYNPQIRPLLRPTVKQYQKTTAKGTTINHFYEKLLLLKDRMNTKTAKQLAAKRHKFIESYLKEFFAEWKGEK